jgi:hypothetical protein
MKHYASYKKRKDLLINMVDKAFWNYFFLDGSFIKISKKRRKLIDKI